MQLTKQANYGLRTLVYCAVNAPRLSRVAEIARAYEISELTLAKFIKPLVDAGLLETARGRNGGIRLARAPGDITMLEVIRLTEDNFALAECFEDDADCPVMGSCDINAALREALGAFFTVLQKHTIADLAKRDIELRDRLGLADLHEPAPAL